ncbi:MAG: FkbM family methyltransferase [Pseudomonadota bacterium]
MDRPKVIWTNLKSKLRRGRRSIDIYRLGLTRDSAAARQQAVLMIQQRRERWSDVQDRFDEIVQGLGSGGLCLDFGANLGEFTERLAQTGADVRAFEPDPYTFEKLQARMAHYPNVTLYNSAVGAEAGTLKMERHALFDEDPEKYSVGTSAFSSVLAQAGGFSFEVEMVGFHDFIAAFDRPVDLVKMDIEGAEVAILEALLQRTTAQPIRAMFVETHEPQMPHLRLRLKAIRKALRPSAMLQEIHLDWQ